MMTWMRYRRRRVGPQGWALVFIVVGLGVLAAIAIIVGVNA
jgi:hypothetical protein